MSARVSQLYCYPIKSARGIALSRAELDRFGIRHDRRFMLIDPTGRFVSQREEPRLALAVPRFDGDDVVVEAPGQSPLRLPLAGLPGPRRDVTLWDWDGRNESVDQGDGPAAWWSAYLGTPVRLVFSPEDSARPTQPTPHGRGVGGVVSFSDGFPLLVVSQASLDDLNARLAEPLPMNRFRPNMVVEGVAPFAEDTWQRFRAGGVTLRGTKPCARCPITTTDQDTAERGVEPLRTLATFRRGERGVLFGQNAEHEAPGHMAVGDPIEVLEIA